MEGVFGRGGEAHLEAVFLEVFLNNGAAFFLVVDDEESKVGADFDFEWWLSVAGGLWFAEAGEEDAEVADGFGGGLVAVGGADLHEFLADADGFGGE